MKTCSGGILVRENLILLAKRKRSLEFYPDVWDIVGGHCRNGETPEETLMREFREEIGVIPTEFFHIAVFKDPEPDFHGEYEYHIFVVTDWTGEPRNVATNEHSDLVWVALDDTKNLHLAHPEYSALFKDIAAWSSEEI